VAVEMLGAAILGAARGWGRRATTFLGAVVITGEVAAAVE